MELSFKRHAGCIPKFFEGLCNLVFQWPPRSAFGYPQQQQQDLAPVFCCHSWHTQAKKDRCLWCVNKKSHVCMPATCSHVFFVFHQYALLLYTLSQWGNWLMSVVLICCLANLMWQPKHMFETILPSNIWSTVSQPHSWTRTLSNLTRHSNPKTAQ